MLNLAARVTVHSAKPNIWLYPIIFLFYYFQYFEEEKRKKVVFEGLPQYNKINLNCDCRTTPVIPGLSIIDFIVTHHHSDAMYLIKPELIELFSFICKTIVNPLYLNVF